MQRITSSHRSNSSFDSLSQIAGSTGKLLTLVCLFVSLPMLSFSANAQSRFAASSAAAAGAEASDKGLIAGTVVDSQGANVPGAQLKLAPLGITVVSNDQGEFRLPEVPAGKYTLTVSYVGFAAADLRRGTGGRADPESDSDAQGCLRERGDHGDRRASPRRGGGHQRDPQRRQPAAGHARRRSSPACPMPTSPTPSAAFPRSRSIASKARASTSRCAALSRA